MREISLTPITWVHGKPKDFRCHLCPDRQATWHRQMELAGTSTIINLVLCTECAGLPAHILEDRLQDNEKGGGMKHTEKTWGWSSENLSELEEIRANNRVRAAAPELLKACVNAESAMFHVLADGGFNTPADRDAMEQALMQTRKAIEAAKAAD